MNEVFLHHFHNRFGQETRLFWDKVDCCMLTRFDTTNLNQIWYKGCKLHRSGSNPAVIWRDGSLEWHEDGVLVMTYDPNSA